MTTTFRRQAQIDTIVGIMERSFESTGTVPTIRDLGELLSIKSTSTVVNLLREAADQGLLDHRPMRAPAYMPRRRGGQRSVEALPRDPLACQTSTCPTMLYLVRFHPEIVDEILRA